jgi:hypothetical protein
MIIRNLKPYIFEIDEEEKTLRIYDKEDNASIIFNKTYTFSLARFLIRYFFRLSIKRRIK